jgi:hypothetical protein
MRANVLETFFYTSLLLIIIIIIIKLKSIIPSFSDIFVNILIHQSVPCDISEETHFCRLHCSLV